MYRNTVWGSKQCPVRSGTKDSNSVFVTRLSPFSSRIEYRSFSTSAFGRLFVRGFVPRYVRPPFHSSS